MGDPLEEGAVVADHQHGGALARQHRLQRLDGEDVEVVGGLVEQQHVRRLGEGPGQGGAPRFAAGKAVGAADGFEPEDCSAAARRVRRAPRRRRRRPGGSSPAIRGSCATRRSAVPATPSARRSRGSGSPASMRSRVDLPAPLRPTRQARTPGSSARSTPSNSMARPVGEFHTAQLENGRRHFGPLGFGNERV